MINTKKMDVLEAKDFIEECPETYGHIFYNKTKGIRVCIRRDGWIVIQYYKHPIYRAWDERIGFYFTRDDGYATKKPRTDSRYTDRKLRRNNGHS